MPLIASIVIIPPVIAQPSFAKNTGRVLHMAVRIAYIEYAYDSRHLESNLLHQLYVGYMSMMI